MALTRANGHEVPLVLHLNDARLAQVPSHILYIHYGFIESSIYVEDGI